MCSCIWHRNHLLNRILSSILYNYCDFYIMYILIFCYNFNIFIYLKKHCIHIYMNCILLLLLDLFIHNNINDNFISNYYMMNKCYCLFYLINNYSYIRCIWSKYMLDSFNEFNGIYCIYCPLINSNIHRYNYCSLINLYIKHIQ